MNTLRTWQVALIDSWQQVWNSFLSVLPNILGAILIFIIGLIIAYWLKQIIVKLFENLDLEKFSKSTGLENYLKKAEIDLSLSELVGVLVEWVVIFVFFLAAVDILGLESVSRVLVDVLGYIPNIFAAAFIIAAGYIISRLVDGLVRGAVASVDLDLARLLGKFARWLIVVSAVFAGISQLEIAQEIINIFFQGLTYTIVLAVGLSFGLGAKDVVSRALSDWYDKIKSA